VISVEEGVVSPAKRCELGGSCVQPLADEPLDAAGSRDQEAASLGLVGVGERVRDPRRGEREASGAEKGAISGDNELERSLEHEEGLGRLAMEVKRRSRVAGGKTRLEERELSVAVGGSGFDERLEIVLEPLTIVRPAENGFLERPAAVARRVELVEALLASAADNVAETLRRRMDVEEERAGVARIPEGVDDVRRRGCEGSRTAAHALHVGTKAELGLAVEDVEAVGVPPVDVGLGPLLVGFVTKPRHDQLVELAEDPERSLGPVGNGLALAGG
jgi:hypothetical protein